MRPRKETLRALLGAMVTGASLLLGSACGSGASGGSPTGIGGFRAGTGGMSAETGGTPAGTGGGSGGSTDTGGSGGAEPIEGGPGGDQVTDDAGDAGGCITNPVSFEDYLNACPDTRVMGCFTFTTPLPSPLPSL